jgi:hypothetical protein
MTNVVCMKWGTKFPPLYVNRLHAMVRRHLARPHRFVCFTDDPRGLDAGIEHFPMPSAGAADAHPEHGWRKLALFSSPLGDLSGPALFLDLDVVIVAAVDPFFDHEPGYTCVVRDYRPLRVRGDTWVGNTSVLRFEAGAHGALLAEFARDFAAIRTRLRNEQEYVSEHFHRRGALRYWPPDWCPSFKHDCVAWGPLSYWTTPRLPPGARIVVFHGVPKPEQAISGHSGKWYRRVRPTPWITQHWF